MSIRRWQVRGRVQGVYYRASTREQALALGLDGHALNLADGSVEVVAAGADAALDALQAWLARGPAMARVEAVELLEPPAQVAPGFRVG